MPQTGPEIFDDRIGDRDAVGTRSGFTKQAGDSPFDRDGRMGRDEGADGADDPARQVAALRDGIPIELELHRRNLALFRRYLPVKPWDHEMKPSSETSSRATTNNSPFWSSVTNAGSEIS